MKTDCAWIKEPTDCPHFADDCKDCDKLTECGEEDGDTIFTLDNWRLP